MRPFLGTLTLVSSVYPSVSVLFVTSVRGPPKKIKYRDLYTGVTEITFGGVPTTPSTLDNLLLTLYRETLLQGSRVTGRPKIFGKVVNKPRQSTETV